MTPARTNGFTLIEMVAVVTIVALVATLAVSRISGVMRTARIQAATRDLTQLRDAFLQPENSYLADLRGIPGFSVGYLRTANLFTATNLYVRLPDDATGRNLRDWSPAWRSAPPGEFCAWHAARHRGWHGPYLKAGLMDFPTSSATRFAGDASFAVRGFFPELTGLRLPDDFKNGLHGCSIYGFPGEPALPDPWGNPYVLQIPPPQAFPGSNTNIADEVRFRYARFVSAGPDGTLSTPCFHPNTTNLWHTSWNARTRRLARQAGLIDGTDRTARGDDLVLFLNRNDTDEPDWDR